MLLIDTVLPLEYLGLGGVVLIVYTQIDKCIGSCFGLAGYSSRGRFNIEIDLNFVEGQSLSEN